MAFVYLVAASGMSFNMHYCMDKLVSWNITGDHVKNCPACSMNQTPASKTQYVCKSCCKDQITQAHFEKVHKAEENTLSKFSFSKIICTYTADKAITFVPIKFIGLNKENAPPPQKHTVPDYIFNCVFRI
ncbi:MAG: hypothetical protein M3015_16000 [Bacteroidota bacterium]|nr:hypothetical protein [Bacteroidota bacterium]